MPMTASKPTIVKVIQTTLEEKEPPQEGEYEFVETWPDGKKDEVEKQVVEESRK